MVHLLWVWGHREDPFQLTLLYHSNPWLECWTKIHATSEILLSNQHYILGIFWKSKKKKEIEFELIFVLMENQKLAHSLISL